MTISFQVEPLFRDFLLPLSERENSVLAENILTDGYIRDPLVVWEERNVLLDGHHRYAIWQSFIAEGRDIPEPRIEFQSFSSELEALRWMLDHQEGRRNLFTTAQRALAVVRNKSLVDLIQDQAEQRMKSGRPVNPNLKSDKGSTRKILARFAGVSADSIDKAIKITNLPNNRELIAEIQNGAKLNSVIKKARIIVENELRKTRELVVLPTVDPSLMGKVDVLHCLDVLDGLDLIEKGSVTASITSPPYALREVAYENPANDYSKYRRWVDFLATVYRKQFDLLRTGGRVFINIDSNNNSDPSEPHKIHDSRTDISNELYKIGYQYYGEICWYKQRIIGRSGSNWGTYASPRSPNLGRNFEYILIYYKDSPILEGRSEDIDITHEEFRKFFPAQWYIRPEHRLKPEEEGYHPAPYPCELVYRLLRMFTYRNDLILDPFCGTGTTCYVAKALGRRYVGIDNSPSYIACANKSLDDLNQRSKPELRSIVNQFRFCVGLDYVAELNKSPLRLDGFGPTYLERLKQDDNEPESTH